MKKKTSIMIMTESNAPLLRVSVSDILSLKDVNEIRRRYDLFLQEGLSLAEETGDKITEVLDVGGVSLTSAVRYTPLLIELLRKGQRYDHAKRIRIINAPNGAVSVWNAVVKALPSLKDKNVEIT